MKTYCSFQPIKGLFPTFYEMIEFVEEYMIQFINISIFPLVNDAFSKAHQQNMLKGNFNFIYSISLNILNPKLDTSSMHVFPI